MNPGESVFYKEKACVVLDANLEGFPLPQEHVLLEELTHYSASRGRVRHLANLNDVNLGGQELLPDSPAD